MMTLPEFKAWVDGLHSSAPAMSTQLLNQRIQDKLRAECAPTPPPFTQNLTKGWVDRADRVHSNPGDGTVGSPYIYDDFGPAAPG